LALHFTQLYGLNFRINPVIEDYRLAKLLGRKYARTNKDFLAGKVSTPEALVDAAIQQLKLSYWEVPEERQDYLEKQINVFVETVIQEVQQMMSERQQSKDGDG